MMGPAFHAPEYYGDSLVVAYRTSKTDVPSDSISPKITCTSSIDTSVLSDGDLATSKRLDLPKQVGEKAWILPNSCSIREPAGEFVWTAMDYLGESGIGAWSYGSPKQASEFAQMKNFLRVCMAKMGADGKWRIPVPILGRLV
jgi:hypothetical protein